MAQPEKKATPRKGASARVSSAKGAVRTTSAETASLLSLIDELTALLEKSDLAELEVEAGETGIILRKPAAIAPAAVHFQAPERGLAAAAPSLEHDPVAAEMAVPAPATRTVRAPLTGVFYAASSPTAPAYVTVGQQVAVGQIIGLIEAMKLFNEIKSDVSGKVVRIVAESGQLVKAKQPLIEVEP